MLVALAWAALVGLLVWALHFLYRRPPAVSLTRDLPASGFEGTRVPLRLRLNVTARLPTRLVLEDPTPRSVVPDRAPQFAAEVVGTHQAELDLNLTLNRRGEYVWPGATLRWADPLGLFWRSAPLPAPAALQVFPGTHGLLLPDLLRPLLSEGRLTPSLGLDDPISLRGAREYVSGDPPGRIHWRLTARTGTLTVRELERMAAGSLTVYVDTNGNDVYVDSAARLAASLIREAAALDLPVAVASSAGVTPSGTGAGAAQAALLHLARLRPDPGAVPRIPPTRSGGNLIILTAGAGPQLIEQAMRARATASRVSLVALPEGFYLEPGESPRRQWSGLPDTVRELERQAGVLAGAGILVRVLRGNQSVLNLSA